MEISDAIIVLGNNPIKGDIDENTLIMNNYIYTPNGSLFHRIKHITNKPCNQIKCARCGNTMTRE